MSLAQGSRLGPYEVGSPLGAGGMGEVYRARDTKLGRDVALKVLPEAFTADPDRLARFEREAKVLASLNHPHIAQIYGLEEADGQKALVLELVEGPTLADRIAQGPISLDEALPIAKQIAEALEAAHEQGIIHRDLKPANVKVKPDGTVKVLDFGLAKAFEPEGFDPNASHSPTLTARATQMGVILGTAAYMSPEQARGKPVDKRADIWAFGVVLYEMLTGRRPFVGEDVSLTLAEVMKSDPDWSRLPGETPPSVRRLLRRCLIKDPRQRLRDVGEVRLLFDDDDALEPSAETSERPRGAPWPVVAALVVAGVLAAWLLRPVAPEPERLVANLQVGLEPGVKLREFHDIEYALSRRAFALSDDGRSLAFTSGSGSRPELFVRRLDEDEAVLIPGTSGAVGPFFSPDAQWIGFWAGGELRKVRADGGPPQRICSAAIPPNGATWSRDGTIFFGAGAEGLQRVAASGGTPQAVTALQGDEGSHGLPQLLPGEDALLFTAGPAELKFDRVERARLVVQSLRTGERKVLMENAADGRVLPTGHVVFLRQGTLMAAPFDVNRLELTGEPLAVRAGILQDVNAVFLNASQGAGQYSISSSGWLAYVPGRLARPAEDHLTWFNRDGGSQPLQAPPGEYSYPRISPDGRRVAVNKDLSSIWLYDIAGETWSRVTPAESTENMLAWSPGGEITYLSDRSGAGRAIYVQAPETPGSAEPLADGELLRPISWSPDGQFLALVRQSTDRSDDIWVLPRGGEAKPFRESPLRLWWPEFSPDGKWLAYAATATDSERNEVYVEPFPGPGPRIQITTDGGSPIWAHSGEELFYARFTEGDPSGMTEMWSVGLKKDGSTLRAGRPRLLFRARMSTTAVTRGFDVTADGQRFLVVVQEERHVPDVTQIHLVVNWFDELERLVPAGN